ncbi:MAG TPA: UPF0758 domain-containing protein [Steroidobacteraceae bacterium]|nr:UPF0758 domain-containing protein [Steroidobacteraceae bacterium]
MSIRHWPRSERPREKLIERGAEALSDAELLGVLLGSGVRGQSAMELARRHFRQALRPREGSGITRFRARWCR